MMTRLILKMYVFISRTYNIYCFVLNFFVSKALLSYNSNCHILVMIVFIFLVKAFNDNEARTDDGHFADFADGSDEDGGGTQVSIFPHYRVSRIFRE